jgi:hypothetical protein
VSALSWLYFASNSCFRASTRSRSSSLLSSMLEHACTCDAKGFQLEFTQVAPGAPQRPRVVSVAQSHGGRMRSAPMTSPSKWRSDMIGIQTA